MFCCKIPRKASFINIIFFGVIMTLLCLGRNFILRRSKVDVKTKITGLIDKEFSNAWVLSTLTMGKGTESARHHDMLQDVHSVSTMSSPEPNSEWEQSIHTLLHHYDSFNSSDIQKSENTYDKSLRYLLQRLAPYVPINRGLSQLKKIIHNNNLLQRLEPTSKILLGDVLRSGCGLSAYKTDTGEDALIENGVVYRSAGPSAVFEKYPSPYKAEIEPHVPFDEATFFEGRPHSKMDEKDKKIILWYTKTRYTLPMEGLQPMRFCPEFPCSVTTNQKYAHNSSAMVFAGELIRGRPPQRRPEQMFIFSNHEPQTDAWVAQSHIKDESLGWKDAFNWTMTYRMDSDITSLYGILRRRRHPIKKNYTTIMEKKTKMLAWMVSNCHTFGKREKYVAELSKYIPVDIYGLCGTFKCPRSSDGKCFQSINAKYKFYLALESTICTDYITEKFFRLFDGDIVVVARGSNDYHKHAPPEIYVNAADFNSPKELADHLLTLAQNDDMYMKMLQEKDKFIAIYEDYPIREGTGKIKYMHYHYEAVAFCEVCQKLWNLNKYVKTVSDINEWFRRQMCRDPTDLKF